MPNSARPKAWFSPEKILWVLAAFAFLFWVFGLPLLWNRLVCPFQVNQGEAINVEFGRILTRGGNLYFNPSEGPYLYPAYPPLFPLLVSRLSTFLQPPFLAPRLLAFAGYLACGFLFAAWGFGRWGKPWAAVLLFLFWVSPTWQAWGSMARMDSFLLAVHFSAFLLLYQMEAGKKTQAWRLVAAGLLTAAALSLKQSALTLPAAYGLSCLFQGRFRPLGLFLTAALLPTLCVFGALQAASHGWFFFWVFHSLPLGFHGSQLFYFLKTSFVPEMGWAVLAVLATLLARRVSPLLKCQLLFSSLMVLALGREGSAENYCLEFWLYALFTLGESWAVEPAGRNSEKPAAWAYWGMTGLFLLGFTGLLTRPLPRTVSQEEMQMKASVLPIYRLPGEHLAMDGDLPLMAGKKLWIMPMEYNAMVKNGKLDPAPLLRDIQSQRFTTIELYDLPRQPLFPEFLTQAVEKDYKVGLKAYGRVWYVPRQFVGPLLPSPGRPQTN